MSQLRETGEADAILKVCVIYKIDKKWPVETLIQDLRFPIRAEQRLTEYFSGLNSSEMSLRDIMGFLITDYEKIPYDLYQVCPAYKQKHSTGSSQRSVFYYSENKAVPKKALPTYPS